MRKISALFLFISLTSGLFVAGCDEKKQNNKLPLLLALAGSGTTVYRGTPPEGDFMEFIVNSGDKTVTISNYTSGDLNLGPYAYVNLPHDNIQAGGFTILNRAELPVSALFPDPDGGDPDPGYLLLSEVPGETVVVGAFDSNGDPYCGPIIGVAVDSGDKSQYYLSRYNIMHVISDDGGSGDPDVVWGFAAFDSAGSTPLDGQLWGLEYSIRNDTGNPLGGGSFGVGSLAKDTVTGAWVDWGSGGVGAWDDAIALLGNRNRLVEMVYGANTGVGGGGLSMPQADSGAFNTANYPGTYAAIAYNYLYTSDTMSVSPYTAVITSDGRIQIFAFGTSTSNPATAIFNQPLAPPSAGTITAFYNLSGIVGSTDTGIQSASECRGLFSANDPNVLVVVMFDPDGKSAGFYLINNNGTEANPSDDMMAFGLAIKDGNFVNP